MERPEWHCTSVCELLIDIQGVIMSGHTSEEHGAFLSQSRSNEDEVLVGERGYWESLDEIARVLVCLEGLPRTAFHLAPFSVIACIALPCQPYLLLPIEILNRGNLLLLKFKDHVSHVGQEVNDSLHPLLLLGMMCNAAFYLHVLCLLVQLETLAYLVDPEL